MVRALCSSGLESVYSLYPSMSKLLSILELEEAGKDAGRSGGWEEGGGGERERGRNGGGRQEGRMEGDRVWEGGVTAICTSSSLPCG